MPKLAAAYVEITAKLDQYKSSIDKLKRENPKLIKKLQAEWAGYSRSVGIAFSVVGASIIGSLGAVTLSAAKAGDEFDKMSLRVGESAARLSALKHAADISGTSILGVENGLKRLSRNMNDFQHGVGESKETFEALGITVVDANGKLRSSIDVMLDISDALNNVDSESQKTAYAMELFGRSGADLLPLLKQGATGITQLTDQAARLGLIIDDKAAKAAAEFNDRLTELKSSLRATTIQIGNAMLPVLQPLVEQMTKVVSAISRWTQAHPGLTGAIGKFALAIGSLMAIGGPMLILAPTIVKITSAIKTLMPILTAFKVEIAATSASVAALTASLWAAYRIYNAWQEQVDMGAIKTRILKERQNELKKAIELVSFALDEYASAHDRTSATLQDIGVSADELSEKFGGLFSPTMNAAQALEVLQMNAANAARHLSAGSMSASEMAENVNALNNAIDRLPKANELWFLKRDTPAFGRGTRPMGRESAFDPLIKAARDAMDQMDIISGDIQATYAKAMPEPTQAQEFKDRMEEWAIDPMDEVRRKWNEYLNQSKESMSEMSSSIQNIFASMFENLLSGNTKSLWEQFWTDLRNIAIRKMATIFATQLLAGIFTGGASFAAPGVGSLIGGLISGGGSNFGRGFGSAGQAAGGVGRFLEGGTININTPDIRNLDTQTITKEIEQGIIPAMSKAAADGIQ